MRRLLKIVPWFAAFFGFLFGVVLSFLVLEVWMGMHNAGGTKLSVVLAVGPAILAFDLTSRVVGWIAPDPVVDGAAPA